MPLHNPYLQAMLRLPYHHIWHPEVVVLRAQYSYTVPDDASIAFIAQALGPQAIEMGAGTGYWAWMLTQQGIDILAFDQQPPNREQPNPYTLDQMYVPVQYGTPATLRHYPDRSLFLCWPPYLDPMALLSLQAYPGQIVVYLGEGPDGACADPTFFKLLQRDWICTDCYDQLFSFPYVNDKIWVYHRQI